MSSLVSYLKALPSEVLAGDLGAITVSLLLVLVGLFIVHAVTGVLLSLLRGVLLLGILALVVYQVVPNYLQFARSEGWGVDTIAIGVFAIVASALAFLAALRSVKRSATRYLRTRPLAKRGRALQERRIQARDDEGITPER